MCILAVIGSLASMSIILKWIDLDWGRHMWDIPLAIWLDKSIVRLLSIATTYPWTACFAKLSILLLYKRLFPYSRLRFFIWGGIIVISALYGTFIIMSFVSPAICVNFHSTTSNFCIFVHTVVNLWQSSVNVVTDFYLVVLPIPRVLKLQMSRRKKIGLVITFASGLGASVASLARLIRNLQLYHAGDSPWTSASISLYAIAELNTGITVACVCTFPHFFNKVRKSKPGSNISRSIRSVLKSRSSRSLNSSVLLLSERKQEQDVIRAVGPDPGISSNRKFKPHESVSDHMREVEEVSSA